MLRLEVVLRSKKRSLLLKLNIVASYTEEYRKWISLRNLVEGAQCPAKLHPSWSSKRRRPRAQPGRRPRNNVCRKTLTSTLLASSKSASLTTSLRKTSLKRPIRLEKMTSNSSEIRNSQPLKCWPLHKSKVKQSKDAKSNSSSRRSSSNRQNALGVP